MRIRMPSVSTDAGWERFAQADWATARDAFAAALAEDPGDPGALQDRGGVGHQAVELAGPAVDGDPGGDGDGAELLEDRDEALGDAARAGEVGAGHDDGELVGAGAADDVAAADQLAQALGDGGEGFVSGGRAAAAVERAEAVDVDEHERGRLAAALGPAQRGGGGLPERVERQDAGTAVLAQVLVALGLQHGDPCVGRAQLITEAAAFAEHLGVRDRRVGAGGCATRHVAGRIGHRSIRTSVRRTSDPTCRMPEAVSPVLGIDPGLANTGYGVVSRRGVRFVARDGGVITTPSGRPLEQRLATIAAAEELRIPFTSGILVGIGETEQDRIEALDMGRRALHDEGSNILMERLARKVMLDFDTARRLFTLICVLHWKG